MSNVKDLFREHFLALLYELFFIESVWVAVTFFFPKVFEFLNFVFKSLYLTSLHFFSCFESKSVWVFEYGKWSLQFGDLRIHLVEDQWWNWLLVWKIFIDFLVFLGIPVMTKAFMSHLLLWFLVSFFLNLNMLLGNIIAVSKKRTFSQLFILTNFLF